MDVIKKLLFVLLLCFIGIAAAADAVDINTADSESLMKGLKGVGPEEAAAIIEYRQQHGPFKDADGLTQVKGIGKKLIDMNRGMITVSKATPQR